MKTGCPRAVARPGPPGPRFHPGFSRLGLAPPNPGYCLFRRRDGRGDEPGRHAAGAVPRRPSLPLPHSGQQHVEHPLHGPGNQPELPHRCPRALNTRRPAGHGRRRRPGLRPAAEARSTVGRSGPSQVFTRHRSTMPGGSAFQAALCGGANIYMLTPSPALRTGPWFHPTCRLARGPGRRLRGSTGFDRS
jgi:hypothetical protein